MAQWTRLCSIAEAPAEGKATEVDVGGVAVCLARVHGELHALDNWCPHRRGPLGQGWVEGSSVVCPWHSWAFDLTSGEALPPDRGKVEVFPVQTSGEDVLVDLS